MPHAPSTEQSDVNLANVFEERAEFLSRSDLSHWTQTTPGDRKILAKLKGPGAKLLTGPRGSGKSTLLRAAYFDLLEGTEVLPVYVNYSRSLALEPLFHHAANALQIFRQWVLMKLVAGTRQALVEGGLKVPPDLDRAATEAEAFIEHLAIGLEPTPDLGQPLRGLSDCLCKWA